MKPPVDPDVSADDIEVEPDVLFRIVTPDEDALARFLDAQRESGAVEVVRALLADKFNPASATVLTRESIVESARLAGFGVSILARSPVVMADIPEVSRVNRFAERSVIPRGRGRMIAPSTRHP